MANKLITLDNLTEFKSKLDTNINTQLSSLETNLNKKQDTLISGTNIKTINGNSILGSGDITIKELEGVTSNKNSDGSYTLFVAGSDSSSALTGDGILSLASGDNLIVIDSSNFAFNSSSTELGFYTGYDIATGTSTYIIKLPKKSGILAVTDDITSALKSYYTSSQVDSLLSNLKKANMQVVSELPTSGEEGIIYLVGSAQPYEMYIWENSAWIDLGTTEVDLSNYYTTTQVDTKLSTKQDKLTAGSNITISGSTISAKNTTYAIATASVAGLVKPISVITKPTINTATTTSNRYYSVQMSSDGNMFVNVPWVNTTYIIDSALSSTSTNPVQNKVIYTALAGKQASLTTAQLNAVNSGVTSSKVTNYDKIVSALGSDVALATNDEIDALFA